MLKDRFRKFLPVVVDLETGGFDCEKNPILEIAIQLIDFLDDKYVLGESYRHHIDPFEGLELNQESLDFLKLDLSHPLRVSVDEKTALNDLFKIINKHKTFTFLKGYYFFLLQIYNTNNPYCLLVLLFVMHKQLNRPMYFEPNYDFLYMELDVF